MTTTVITTVNADDVDEWTDAVISNCFKSLNAAEDPARGSDTELALKQALTAFYLEYNTPKTEYDSVFTDFDYDLTPYLNKLGSGWEKESWRNNACPCFIRQIDKDQYLSIWCDYDNIELSENVESRKDGTMHKFGLDNQHGEVLASSNDFTDILNKIWELGL